MTSPLSLLDISEILYKSEWSIFSLPPISNEIIESNPGYPEGCISLYLDVFTSSYFMCVFVVGLIIWYLLECLGCFFYTHYVPLDHQRKMQKEQFAGHFISILHALMIAGASTIVCSQYTPRQALNASMDEPIIKMYKYAATWSASYFLLDSMFITYYYKQKMNKKLAFVVHHFCTGICMVSVLLTHPIITYISALNFLIEWSTVMLNIRIFARIWSLKMVYFIGGWAVIITYPATRMGWNLYMIYTSFFSEYLTVYTCKHAYIVLGGAEIFVVLLSTFYYVSVIMVNPQKMYILKNAPKPMEKDC